MNDEISEVVHDIVTTQEVLNKLYNIEPARAVPAPPAPDRDLDALEKHLAGRGLRLPPSYRAFLKVHNGIKAFKAALDLLPAKEVTRPVDPALENDFPMLSRLIIASGNTPEFISLDPETAKRNGEMEVVWVMGDGGQFRYENFGLFLRELRDELQKSLAKEQGDRKKLRRK